LQDNAKCNAGRFLQYASCIPASLGNRRSRRKCLFFMCEVLNTMNGTTSAWQISSVHSPKLAHEHWELCSPYHDLGTYNEENAQQPSVAEPQGSAGHTMLYTLAVILIVAWLLGFISDFTLGGFIHILLLAAIILIVVRLIQGKKI
jgi:hypothetical protein